MIIIKNGALVTPRGLRRADLAMEEMCIRDSFYTSPSRCAVADSCAISIDRRMTAGETWESCLDEIRNLPAAKKYGDDVKVSMRCV